MFLHCTHHQLKFFYDFGYTWKIFVFIDFVTIFYFILRRISYCVAFSSCFCFLFELLYLFVFFCLFHFCFLFQLHLLFQTMLENLPLSFCLTIAANQSPHLIILLNFFVYLIFNGNVLLPPWYIFPYLILEKINNQPKMGVWCFLMEYRRHHIITISLLLFGFVFFFLVLFFSFFLVYDLLF